MRVVIQRVLHASVSVDGAVVGEIGGGSLVLVAVATGDGPALIQWMADKVLGLRIFPDEAGRMNRSVREVAGSVLVVSQFTLYGDARRGRRPSFVAAAAPAEANALYQDFVALLRLSGTPIATGEFGADMKVELLNDGPVTLIIDSPAATVDEGASER
jgi:D-tyrosyl-tRNA(Tyr) deacylase